MDEGQELENSTRLAHLEVEAGGCPVVFRQHVRRFADGTGRCALSLSSLLSVPPPQCFFRFASGLVLGTAFNVRSNEGVPFSLSVKRGKVKVLLKQEEQTVFVEAGETVILQGGSLLVSETENPELFDRYTSNIRFKDECLEDVLRAINKESAGWQIEAASPTLGKRRLTVEFSNNSPESVAELICWTFDLKCTRQGNRLILSEQ